MSGRDLPISILSSRSQEKGEDYIPEAGDEQAARVLIYLAGSVPKGRDDTRAREEMWSEEDERRIKNLVSAPVQTLNPNSSGVRRADFYANFGCDLHLVESSDVVFVDGRAKRGIGVGAEMMFAQMRGTRVIAICPDDSAYRRRDVRDMFGEDLDEWIHPFVFGLTDHIAASLDEAINWVNSWLESGRPAKSPDDMREAISYYRSLADLDDGAPEITVAPRKHLSTRRAS